MCPRGQLVQQARPLREVELSTHPHAVRRQRKFVGPNQFQ